MSSDEKEKLSPDRPHSNPSEDLFGYAPFAQMIARSVLRGSPKEGLVVGIYGEWGLGKTTLLNFIEHFVRIEAGDEDLIVVRYNPWWVSGREDLLRRFLHDFERAALKAKAKNKTLADRLRALGDAVSEAMPEDVPWYGRIGWKLFGGKLKATADVIELKKDIEHSLLETSSRVLVLVDDIDRLFPSEMLEVFRLVRSVGDLPNVHYVLGFDRKVVAEALSRKLQMEDGERYLEKIIQAPFDLPRPPKKALREMFIKRLNAILIGTEDELFDKEYWNPLFSKGIASFLQTPRDVVRLTNALTVLYPTVKNEVNPADFTAIETLRLFAPTAYEAMRSNRGRFVGMFVNIEHRIAENKAFHEKWIGELKVNQEQVRSMVAHMFPKVGGILTGRGSALEDAGMRKARRICVDDVFDAYFQYSLGSGLSRVQFLECLSKRDDQLGDALLELNEQYLEDGQTKLRAFLEMLQDELDQAQPVDATQLLVALCNVGDAFIAKMSRASWLDIPGDYVLAFVIERLLKTLPRSDRAMILRRALESAGISIAGRLVTIFGAQHGKYGESAEPSAEQVLPSAADLAMLETYVRARIEQAASRGALWGAADLPRVLFDWERLGGGAEMRAAVAAWIREDDHLIALIAAFFRRSSAGRAVVDLDSLSSLTDVEAAVDRAQQLRDLPGGSSTRDVLKVFIEAYHSAGPARAEHQGRLRVLRTLLEKVVATGWYPNAEQVRVELESDRETISQMRGKRLIATRDDLYMVTLEGLKLLGSDPVACRERSVCAMLHKILQEKYRQKVKAGDRVRDRIPLDEVLELLQQQDRTITLMELRRSARLLNHSSGLKGHTIPVYEKDGVPDALGLVEDLIEFSIDETPTER